MIIGAPLSPQALGRGCGALSCSAQIRGVTPRMSGRHLRAGNAGERTNTLTRTADQRSSQTGIVILSDRGENLSVHGRKDNKPSLSTVWQKYPNGLPTVCQTRRNPRSTPFSQIVRKCWFRTPIRPHGTISETVPRLRRDCCETNVRPLGDSILRIRRNVGSRDPTGTVGGHA